MDEYGTSSHEMSRWQGSVDAKLGEHGRRLDTINGDARAAAKASEETLVQLAVLKTKVALWATLGSLLGAGFVTGLIGVLSRLVA